MMGIVLPETCCACNKICNKYNLLHLVGILFPHNSRILLENFKLDVGTSVMHVYVTARNYRKVTRRSGVNFKLHPRK